MNCGLNNKDILLSYLKMSGGIQTRAGLTALVKELGSFYISFSTIFHVLVFHVYDSGLNITE
jgi:hypothetical protein